MRCILKQGAIPGHSAHSRKAASTVTPGHTFPGPQAKLSRARELRDQLNSYVKQHFSDKSHLPTLAVRLDSTTRESVLFVQDVPPLGAFFERVSILAGDIVNNLRSTLDHLVHELALHHTGGGIQYPKRTKFPIAETPRDYGGLEARSLEEVAPQHRAIIESFQPYHPMDADVSVGLYFHPLAMLRDLSNADKHRLLTPVLIPSTGISLEGSASMSVIGGMVLDLMNDTFAGRPIVAQAMVPGLELGRSPWVTPDLTVTPEVVGTSLPMVAFSDGRSVVAVLDKLIRATDTVLAALDP